MGRFQDDNSEDSLSRVSYKATCSDCGQECEVTFEPKEGRPVRCNDCFKKSRPPRRSFGRPQFRRNDREMHKAVCAECKQECEVPFKPVEGKPVLCRDCFRNKKSQNQDEF